MNPGCVAVIRNSYCRLIFSEPHDSCRHQLLQTTATCSRIHFWWTIYAVSDELAMCLTGTFAETAWTAGQWAVCGPTIHAVATSDCKVPCPSVTRTPGFMQETRQRCSALSAILKPSERHGSFSIDHWTHRDNRVNLGAIVALIAYCNSGLGCRI